MKFAITVLYFTVFIFFGYSSSVFARTYVIANKRVTATFNDDGLQYLQDFKLSKTFAFTADNFSITLNAIQYSKSNATLSAVEQSGETIVFHYQATGFNIDLVYALKAGYVEKTLRVIAKSAKEFNVEEIKLMQYKLLEAITGNYIPHTGRPEFKTNDYGVFLRFADATGLLMAVHNPFLKCTVDSQQATINYAPQMKWKNEYGAFLSDAGNIGAYHLTGINIPAKLIPEWNWTNGVLPYREQQQDQAEVDTYTNLVNEYVMPSTNKSIKMNVGWCENDYQIDVSTTQGREEYKRIIDQSAALGLDHILFAPSNSALGSRDQSTDDWGWENLLWLGLGIQIRKGEFNVAKDPIPTSIQTILDYAKSKNVSLLAYIYPVLPFAGNSEWIVEGSSYHNKKRNASIGVRSFQDYLINTISTFYERTGISGFSYDYTFLWYEGSSRYEQWWGWRRVKETLRKKYPAIVIDGRQLDQLYGPWSWLANSFPHPTAEDEQPESFIPFPDLHFDRVSANRQRYTAYRYRVKEYCPPVLMPGFIFHQTPRMDYKNGEPFLQLTGFRERDWDYLGWKYSLFSSIATAGLNNVVNMFPARDMEELKYFSAADKTFIRQWLNWTDSNRTYLLNTKFILGQPAFGKVDGTTAIKDNKGFIFLFNPNARKMQARFFLDESIGLKNPGSYQLKIVFPTGGKVLSSEAVDLSWKKNDLVQLDLDGASCMVLQIEPVVAAKTPVLYNLHGTPKLNAGTLYLNKVEGEVGTTTNWAVKLMDNTKILKVIANGNPVAFSQNGNKVVGHLTFAGTPFSHMQQVGEFSPDFSGGTWKGRFSIPSWIGTQLSRRRATWPINWTAEDYKTTWLAPERLLLFVQIAEPADSMQVKFELNGQNVPLTKAYSSVWPNKRSFVGWYLDVTNVPFDTEHQVLLHLPALKQGQFQGLFFENVEAQMTGEIM